MKRGLSLGALHRVEPIGRDFGWDRGTPIDRVFIDGFIDDHRADVRGRVMEIGDDSYTRRYGGARVSEVDILHAHAGNPRATLVGDLSRGDDLPSDRFDCILLIQTLQYVGDPEAAVHLLHRMLRSGGVLLATFPGVSPISTDEWGALWSWGFTPELARRLLEMCFRPEAVQVRAAGNPLATAAFLHGLGAEELRPEELRAADPGCDLILLARAQKTSP
jgi:SAM-dependent methyltransferase